MRVGTNVTQTSVTFSVDETSFYGLIERVSNGIDRIGTDGVRCVAYGCQRRVTKDSIESLGFRVELGLNQVMIRLSAGQRNFDITFNHRLLQSLAEAQKFRL